MKYLLKFNNYLNESVDKDRSGTWCIEYNIILYYCYKFGYNNLGLNENDLSDMMNVKLGSFIAHLRQFVFLENNPTDTGLAKPGTYMEYVFYNYNKYSENDLLKIVLNILDQIDNGMTNELFLKKNKLENKIKSEEKSKIRTEYQTEKEFLKKEYAIIIQNYNFKVGEKITLHNKKSDTEPYDCIITKGGLKPYFKRLDRNTEVEFGPLNKQLYDIIYPHNLDAKYRNIKID